MTYIEEKLTLSKQKWMLTEIDVIYILDSRAVFTAKSLSYGEVILKLNSDIRALISEYRMLETINGRACCKAYEFDSLNGMLLEEKIIPGTVLRNESDVTIRIQRFAEVFCKIHYQVSNNYSYDTYLDWLDRTCTKMQHIQHESMLDQKMLTAREIGYEMFKKYPERVLLHGDLHHDNMLLTKNGDYVIIDPKGVVGPAIFDIPRFIMNELDPGINKNGIEQIQSVIRIISEKLGYPIKDINKLFFMEVVLGNSWCVEDGDEPNLQDLLIASKILQG